MAAASGNPTVFLLMVSGQVESAQVGQRAGFVQRLPEWRGEPSRFFCFAPSGGRLGISRPGAAYAVAHSKSNLGGGWTLEPCVLQKQHTPPRF